MAIISGSSLHRLFPLPSTSYPNAPIDSFCSLAQPPISFPSLVSWGSSRHAIPRIPSSIAPAFKTLSNAELLALPPSASAEDVSWNVPLDSGVYAVYDRKDDLQFIGIARNIAASVRSHRNAVPELCCSVKVGLVDDPTKTALTQAWKSWMEEHVTATGKVPLGNEPGNSTWVRQVPRKKPDLRLMPNRHAQLAVPLEELIGQLVKEKRVVAFIKGSRNAPSCGFSEKVVGILEREGVEYESVDVLDEEHNGGLREALKGYSNWPTFPQVFVKGELVGGCDILSSMHEGGELAGLLTG